MILAGDCGATKTVLGLWDDSAEHPLITDLHAYHTGEFNDLIAIVENYLSKFKEISVSRACIGVPGPVINGKCKLTNLNQTVNEKEISEKFGFPFSIVNDMIIHCFSIPVTGKDDLECIYSPSEKTEGGVSLVIAPGTGLGQAFFINDNNQLYAFPSESGHRFMPCRSYEQEDFCSFLFSKSIEPVYDNILSGSGIELMFEFFYKELHGDQKVILHKTAEQVSKDSADGNDSTSQQAMDLFCRILAYYCQELALIFEPFNGIYLTGGICQKNSGYIKRSIFPDILLQHHSMSHLLSCIEINIVTDRTASLKGAVNFLTRNR